MTCIIGLENNKEVWIGSDSTGGYDSSMFSAKSYDGYMSFGMGSEYALGSLHSTDKLHMRPELRIREALRAASRFCDEITPPYTLVNTFTNEVIKYAD